MRLHVATETDENTTFNVNINATIQTNVNTLGHCLVLYRLEDCIRSCIQNSLHEYLLGATKLCSTTLFCALLAHGYARDHSSTLIF